MNQPSTKQPEAAGVVSWNICGRCNYSCSYCAQGKHHSGEPSAESIGKICSFLCALGPGWEVKLSGGEPFLCSSFDRIVTELVAHRLLVSVVTNFSFGLDRYHQFIEATGDRLGIFSLSFHPEYVSWSAFLKKAARIARGMARRSSISSRRPVVNVVAQRKMIGALEKMKKDCDRFGLSFAPQIERHHGVPIEYDSEERATLERITGAGDGIERIAGGSNRFKGLPCFAGMEYFIVTPEGACYSCYPGKRDGSGYLGNAAEGTVRLRERAEPCPYDVCPCSVPLHRGKIVLEKES